MENTQNKFRFPLNFEWEERFDGFLRDTTKGPYSFVNLENVDINATLSHSEFTKLFEDVHTLTNYLREKANVT